MSDYIAPTAVVTRYYCPRCEPDADPIREALEIRYCSEPHMPGWSGTQDALVGAPGFISAEADAGGESNRRWCEFFHGAYRARIK